MDNFDTACQDELAAKLEKINDTCRNHKVIAILIAMLLWIICWILILIKYQFPYAPYPAVAGIGIFLTLILRVISEHKNFYINNKISYDAMTHRNLVKREVKDQEIKMFRTNLKVKPEEIINTGETKQIQNNIV